MSTNLSLATVLEKNKLSSDVPFLALLDLEIVDPSTGVVVVTQHIANNPESVVFQGQTYEAGGFDLTLKKEAGKTADVQITVVDYTQEIEAYMQQYGGGVGSNVTLYIVRADALGMPAEIVEFFQIVAASAQDYKAAFTLGAENSLMITFPRRRQFRDFCSYRYKDPDTCGYTGGLATCDLTLQGPNGCAAHDNTVNFGGFPGLNSNAARYY